MITLNRRHASHIGTMLIQTDFTEMDRKTTPKWLCQRLLFCTAISLAGCWNSVSSTTQKDIENALASPMKLVVPVAGTILVDGKPQKNVVVYAHQLNVEAKVKPIYAATNAQGYFSFATYTSGDGIEPGEYKLTFKWLKEDSTGDFVEPDLLNWRYSDPENSEFLLKVTQNKPQSTLNFQLTTQ